MLTAWAARVTKLDLSGSSITALPTDISILTRLTELDLHHNELKSIPPQIGDLTNLRVLDISRNPQLESLPVQLWKLTNLQKLNIEGNHPNMYDGIKPSMETSAILAVLKQQADAKTMQPCYRLKLMLVGQENVGKTTLAKALKVHPAHPCPLTPILYPCFNTNRLCARPFPLHPPLPWLPLPLHPPLPWLPLSNNLNRKHHLNVRP